MNSLQTQKSINAIIVCYYPVIKSLIDLISSLKSIDKIIIVKNSGFELTNVSPNTEIIEAHSNLGTAAAYNLGFKHLGIDCKYVLLLDQDTILAPDFFENIASELINFVDKQLKYFIISPIEFSDDNTTFKGWGSMLNSYMPFEVRASGMVISKTIIDDNFVFNENLFLDYADWEYCWRLFDKLKIRPQLSKNAKIYHKYGDMYDTHFKLKLNNCSPLRLYSQIISLKYLLGLYYVSFIKKLYLLFRIFLSPVKSLFFKDFKARIFYIILGLKEKSINKEYFNKI